MKLYNTLTRKVEEIQPLNPPEILFYACGPTVYDYAHLGHLRRYSMDDVLIRTLRELGSWVNWVQNVTDVGHLSSDGDTGEDKLEKGAKKYQATVWEIAKKFEDHFYDSLKKMGNLRPDHVCRVTEHIPEQIEFVKGLEKKGFTYVIEGDGVYFDTSKLDDYGKLARLDIENLQAGARVESVAGKKNPTDFALWKFERQGENRAMAWESPWAKRGFPGWHIECSTISRLQLGDQIDIHSGGVDHIPVHHTNEIAQSEALTGKKPFVKYWVHHNFLQVEGKKMSKSLGNLFTLEDVLERGFNPLALRLLFLSAHYRSEMNFTWENLAGAKKSYQKLVELVKEWARGEKLAGDLGEKAAVFEEKFIEAMSDDLKTPAALAVLWEVTKSGVSDQEKLRLILQFDRFLGLRLRSVAKNAVARSKESDSKENKKENKKDALSAEVKMILAERQDARKKKKFKKADQLRDRLLDLGWEVKDTAEGQELKRV